MDPASSLTKVFEADAGAMLGAGVFGKCVLVREVSTGEEVCAKVAAVQGVGDLARAALRVEFAALSHMNHPNVLRAFALVSDFRGKAEAMLTERMSSDLRAWLEGRMASAAAEVIASAAAEDPLAFAERSCLLQVAAGISHVHGRGVAHLDIKPENILVNVSKGPPAFMLADFGNCEAVRVVDGVPHSGFIKASRVNTATYRPFELFRLFESRVLVVSRFDVWAFGCLVFDVGQVHSRQRGASGKLCRLMGGVDLENAGVAKLWETRNGRIDAYARNDVRAVILSLQPRSVAKKDQIRPAALDAMLRALRVGA
jgi:serine/threonine protein kinase